ncbi:MAG: SMI1/KNR4 family protein [Myxococcota bacterium]
MPFRGRSRLYRSFTAKWGHPDYAPEPESEQELAEIEQELDLRLPEAYRQFMQEIGPVISSGALSRAIESTGRDVRALSEFLAARDVAKSTRAWRRSNLPKELVTIAVDGSGNQFCIRPASDESAGADAPIWLWLHESDTAEPVASSFAGWLSELVSIERVPED